MTLSELLAELKAVDPETYEALRNYPIYCSGEGALTVNLLESRNHVSVADALQGCIQRACERRESWEVSVWWKDNKWVALIRLPGGYTNINQMFAEESDSPTDALLTAYIAAVKEESNDHNTARGG